ncbi:MAG: DUF3147 family protein [Candidatus Acidiferrum sp.]
MRVQFQVEALRKIKWHDLVTRFLFGGAITAAAGLVAQHYGPGVGGLFLAFPAIFPASVTLLAKKQAEKKATQGMDGAIRGRKAAAIESRGTAIGTIGLACFALAIWQLLQRWNPAMVLLASVLLWLAVSVFLWALIRRIRHSWHRHHRISL